MFGASAAFEVSFSFAFVAYLDSFDDIWDKMNHRTFSGIHSRYRYHELQSDALTHGEIAGGFFSVKDRVFAAHFLRFH